MQGYSSSWFQQRIVRNRRVIWLLLAVIVGYCSLRFEPLCRVARAQSGTASRRPKLLLKIDYAEEVYTIAWSPDGRTLASGSNDNLVKLWDARTGALRQVLKGHAYRVFSVAFSPDGKLLASGSDDKRIKIWNVGTGKLIRTLTQEDEEIAHKDSVHCVVWSPDGKVLASAGHDKVVHLWDAATGDLLRTLKGHEDSVYTIDFSPDGKLLASGGDDVRLWDARTGAPVRRLEDITDVLSLDWSPDGKLLATASFGGTLSLLDTGTWQVLHTGKSRGVMKAVAFSPDGTLVASGSGYPPDDSEECDVQLWDARTGQLQQTFKGHREPVTGVAFAPTGKSVVSASSEGTLKLWRAAGGHSPVTFLPLPGYLNSDGIINWVASTDDGYYDASPGAARIIKWKIGKDQFPVEAFDAIFHRPDIIERLLQGEAAQPGPEVKTFLAGSAVPPAVAFVTPAIDATVQGESIDVQVVATDDTGVGDVEFLVNGRPVVAKSSGDAPQQITEETRGEALVRGAAPDAHKISRHFRASVPLPPGESKITVKVVAHDAGGLQGWDAIDVQRDLTARGAVLRTADDNTPQTETGDLYALAVGVSRYRDATYNLQFSAADATSFSALWPAMKDRLYQNVHLTQLIDDRATTAGVQTELDKLVKTVTNKDTVLIFLAGHGLQINARDFYFATHDIDFAHPATTGLAWTALTGVLAKLPAKRVVLFLDACHSGGLLAGSQASNERLAEALVKRAGVMVFASSRGDQFSFESPAWQHGAFTKALLEGIAEGKADLDVGGGRDGFVTVGKLLVYLQTRVPKLTDSQQHPACPLMQDFGEPFRLAQIETAN